MYKNKSIVSLVKGNYTGYFRVIHSHNLFFDKKSREVALASIVEPVNLEGFKAAFGNDSNFDDITGFEITIPVIDLKLAPADKIICEAPDNATYWCPTGEQYFTADYKLVTNDLIEAALHERIHLIPLSSLKEHD